MSKKTKLFGITIEGSCASDHNGIAFKTRAAAKAWCVNYWEPHSEDDWDDDWRDSLEDLAWIHEITVVG